MRTTIGGQIAKSLKRHGMSQNELAKRPGISGGTLSRYISGEREPKPGMVADIATALETTSDYLLGTERDGFDLPRIREILAKNAASVSDRDKKTLIDALFGEG